MPSRTEHDPRWLASRYVLGELSALETAAFERRLLDDQGAREAVAAAVELVGAIAIVGRDRPLALPRSARRARKGVAWLALASSAAAVLIAAPGWFEGGSKPETEASEVASAWSGLRDRPAIEAEGLDLLDQDVATLPGPTDAEATPDRPLPSWLVAGAVGPLEESPRVED